MKHIDEYRDGDLARAIAATIAREAQPGRTYRFMEFCGGHTHAISRYGIEDLLPSNVEMVHGPGCPVCVLPVGRIDHAIALAMRPEVTLCTYADLMRVPASGGHNLLKAKAAGADIRMIYSSMDAVQIAEAEPGRQVVFFAIGFETTTPSTAMAIEMAHREQLANFSVFCNHVLTPSAIRAILDTSQPGAPSVRVGRLRGAGARQHGDRDRALRRPGRGVRKACGGRRLRAARRGPGDPDAGAPGQCGPLRGREPVHPHRHAERQPDRPARHGRGVRAARQLRMARPGRAAEERPALRIRSAYGLYDAERRFDIATRPAADNPACECGDVLRALKRPADCKLFGTVCSPETPMGSCMVSPEGACAAHWTYGRFRTRARAAPDRAAA